MNKRRKSAETTRMRKDARFAQALGLLGLIFLITSTASGQSASDGFNPGITNHVSAVAVQADGRILVAGKFLNVAGVPRTNLARLNPDGMLDASYVPAAKPTVDSNARSSLTIQPDGKTLILGSYVNQSGQLMNGLIRLETDGSIDQSFRPFPAVIQNSLAHRVGLQPDGRILLLDGAGVVRLNPDGSSNATFSTEFNAWNLVVQRDGRYFLAGGFPGEILRRFSQDGVRDLSFAPYLIWLPNVIEYTHISSLAVQPDGGVLICGWFSSVNSQSIAGLLPRIKRDGTLDTNATTGPMTGFVGSVDSYVVQPDGKILALTAQLRRHLPSGPIDPTFKFNWNREDSFPTCAAVQPDGKILLGGSFRSTNGLQRGLLRLYPDGTLDSDFPRLPFTPQALAVQPDGKLLLGTWSAPDVGEFSGNCLWRIGFDGRRDPAFQPAVATNVQTVMVQSDGGIVIGGGLGQVGGQVKRYLARVSGANGALDSSFNPQLDGQVWALAQQDDGKLLAGGEFNNVNGQVRPRLVRLQTDGSVDGTFSSAAFAPTNCVDCQQVGQITVQPDGRVLVAGAFKLSGDGGRTNLVRLKADGTVDPSFRPVVSGGIAAMQSDRKILVIGESYGMTEPLVRLNADGRRDPSFSLGMTGLVTHAALQADGKIVIGFAIEPVGLAGIVARLNSDGSLDASFNGMISGGAIFGFDKLVQQFDGKILSLSPLPTARFSNPTAALQSIAVASNGEAIAWLLSGAFPQMERVTFEQSLDGTNYVLLGSGVPTINAWRIANVSIPFNRNVFVRVRGWVTTGNGWNYNTASLIESVSLVYLTPTPQEPKIVLTHRWLQGSNQVLQYHFPNPSALPYQLFTATNLALPTYQWQRQTPPELDFFDSEGRYVFWVTGTNAAQYLKLHLP